VRCADRRGAEVERTHRGVPEEAWRENELRSIEEDT